ncbi:MAG TPA: CoA ester lyase, partial [Hyphomicrobiaceae bacterium]|nr:CoA ester lyase [Hyphomicrobiaceae bacterium]
MQPNRTFLFAPGNHARKVEKVFDAGADAVILDLEDAVAISEKTATRKVVVDALQRPRKCRGYIRVNALDTPFCFGDVEASVAKGVDGIILPKVERAAELEKVDWMMSGLEEKAGLRAGAIDLIPILETGRGIANAREICGAGGRLKRVAFGAGDYTRDMGMEWTLGEGELVPAQAEVVLASRINNLEPPLDTVFIHIREDEAFKASSVRARQFGFQGKMCIHPVQVPLANAAFTPTGEETAWARKIIAAFQEAEAKGSASIQVDGYFVDYPIVVKAERVVA